MFWKGQFNVYTWLQLNLGDVQNLALTADKLNHSFVDPHLVPVPGFGTFTTWGLSSGDPHSPGWHWSWSFDLDQIVLASAVDGFGSAADFGAGFVDSLWALSGDGDSDVGLLDLLFGDFVFLFHGDSW